MSESEPIFRSGDVLADAYEVRALIGEGGMGQVFDGHDRNLGRRVAIKANFPEVNHSVKAEARALAAVRHPGVVTVYALGTQADVDYLVMEHVSGVSLARHLDRVASMPLGERLDVLIAIADGLAAIHRAGISHGDVKPDNVLLAPSGRVVLMDLGLVRAAYEPDEGLVQGTPAYMAPETVSPRYANGGWHLVDVYAFGVTCFRVLAGKLPFEIVERYVDDIALVDEEDRAIRQLRLDSEPLPDARQPVGAVAAGFAARAAVQQRERAEVRQPPGVREAARDRVDEQRMPPRRHTHDRDRPLSPVPFAEHPHAGCKQRGRRGRRRSVAR